LADGVADLRERVLAAGGENSAERERVLADGPLRDPGVSVVRRVDARRLLFVGVCVVLLGLAEAVGIALLFATLGTGRVGCGVDCWRGVAVAVGVALLLATLGTWLATLGIVLSTLGVGLSTLGTGVALLVDLVIRPPDAATLRGGAEGDATLILSRSR